MTLVFTKFDNGQCGICGAAAGEFDPDNTSFGEEGIWLADDSESVSAICPACALEHGHVCERAAKYVPA